MKQAITFFTCCALLISCGQPADQNETIGKKKLLDSPIATNSSPALPFIGKRLFETRHGVSGTGTPHRFVEIKPNGDVYFSYEQEDHSENTIIKEEFYAGKFKTRIKCFLKDLEEGVVFYEIQADKIYEIDEQGKRVKREDCCGVTDTADNCSCEGDLYDLNSEE